MSKKCGVYEIVVRSTGERYIGSSVNMHARFVKHRWQLKNGIHEMLELQAAYNTGGLNALIFRAIEECDKSIVRHREQHHINTTECINCKSSCVNDPVEITNAHKHNISSGMKGKNAMSVYVKYADGREVTYLSSLEASKAIGVSHATIGRWCNQDSYNTYLKRGIDAIKYA